MIRAQTARLCQRVYREGGRNNKRPLSSYGKLFGEQWLPPALPSGHKWEARLDTILFLSRPRDGPAN